MAQSGFTPIQIYSSSTASNVPLAANLTNSTMGAELAINIADGKLFYKDSGGTVQVLATKAGALGTVTSVSGTGTVNGLTLTGTVTTSGSLTLGGTLDLSSPPAIGGTTAAAGTFTNLAYTGTLTGGTGVINIGSGQIYKDSSGNVGIGTSSPVDLLTIYRSSGSGITSGISLQTAAGGVGDGSYIKWTGAAAGEKIARIDGVMEGTDVGSIRFNTGNGADSFAERMRISSAGGLSVGTTADPGAGNLQVAGSIVSTRITPRVLESTANSATPTLNTDNYDMMVITGQSVAITSFTTNLSGTPTNGQKLWIAITGTGAIAITWGASFESSTITLPTTTVSTNRLDVGFVWNATISKWRCVASA